MERSWRSAEAETHQAKADALSHVIDSLKAIEEILPSHEQVMSTRKTAHMLSVVREQHEEKAKNLRPVVGG
jgi:hypothetical protein